MKYLAILFAILTASWSCDIESSSRLSAGQSEVETITENQETANNGEVAKSTDLNEKVGVDGRAIIHVPDLGPIVNSMAEGVIAVKMCVNPSGDVVFAELIKEDTTIRDRSLIKKASKLSTKYKYERKMDAPEEQCGTFTFKLDVEKKRR